MLIPKVDVKEFKKYGFKKCKGIYGQADCYYLCVAKGCKMLFVSPKVFCINIWNNTDPRIHKNANCKFSDKRDYMDIVYQLIKADMLESEVANE
jgi:hypothetical protein